MRHVLDDPDMSRLARRRAWPFTLRAIALLIAVTAVIDPAFTSAHRARPVLSLVAVDEARDRDVLADLRQQLAPNYTLVSAPLPSAIGTVLVGTRLPTGAGALARPVVVVSPITNGPSVAIRRIQTPARAMLESRVTVSLTLVTRGFDSAKPMPAREIGVELTRGDIVVSRKHVLVEHDTVLTVPLTFVPSAIGPEVLQARAYISQQSDTARSDVVVDVHANRWSVLFFDRRPSWMSTFVRRALERDPRFAVTSRIITSTNVSRQTGRPPEGLDAIARTGAFDAVVIGAPDALTARDVDGITTMLNAHGASVLLLADHAAPLGAVKTVLDFGGWRTIARRVPAELSAPMSGDQTREPLRLKGLSVGVPQRLPALAEPLAILRAADSNSVRASNRLANSTTSAAQTVIWRVPVGLGQLVISGAFDAWRYRDTAQSTFDATWRDLVDDAASQRQTALDVRLSPSLVVPRARTTLVVTLRDTMPAIPIRVTLRAVDAPTEGPTPLTLGAPRDRGQFVASFRAPAASGRYEALVVQGPDTARVPLVVMPSVAHDADNEPDLLSAWATSGGGLVVPRDSAASVTTVLDAVLRPIPKVSAWHPMRSAWWIVPFALALVAEWWIRRRRGLA